MPTAFSMSELRDSRVGGIEKDGDDGSDWTVSRFCALGVEALGGNETGAGGEDGEPLHIRIFIGQCRSSCDMQPWLNDRMCRLLDLKVWKHVSGHVGWSLGELKSKQTRGTMGAT